jgi:hypothetical protein
MDINLTEIRKMLPKPESVNALYYRVSVLEEFKIINEPAIYPNNNTKTVVFKKLIRKWFYTNWIFLKVED